MGIRGNIDLVHGSGIQACIVHDSGEGRGGGIEILHLLRVITHFPDVLGQLNGFLQGGAGVAGHEIGNQILLHAVLPVEGKVFLHKLIVDRILGLAHPGQNGIGNVFRGNLQLSGNVVLHQLLQEGILFVCQQVVKADAAADKDLLYSGELAQLPQQGNIVAVVGVHVLAGRGVQALPPAAGTLCQLLFTGGMAEIGGGAAYIVDIALEVLVVGHALCFPENGFVASGLDDPPLMEGQGAEGAGTEAAPVGNQAEFHLVDGRNAAVLGVAGVPGTHIGQLVNSIHLRCGQRLLRRVLHHKFPAVGLRQPLGGEGVTVAVLDLEGLGVFALVLL